MAKNLLNKYVWLVETIYKAKRITFETINEKWLDTELSEGVELPSRTFHKWRIAIEEMFGLVIDCERKGGYHYFIVNVEELKAGGIRNWLLNTMSVSNLLIDNLQLKDRILLEHVPSGQEYLSSIMGAMKTGQRINMTYQSFWRNESNTFKIEPYCVKLFKQRWYVAARNLYYVEIRIYSLDRILDMEVLEDEKFKISDSFDPSQYFEEYYNDVRISFSAELAHPKSAIEKRNFEMIDMSDLIIFYVTNTQGGAYKALKYAEKSGKKIINLANLT